MNSKRKEIKLSKSEENALIFDERYYGVVSGDKYFTIGCIPVKSRITRIIGKRDTYIVMHITRKDVRVYRKTHDLKLAEFSYANAVLFDQWQSALRLLASNNHNGNKNVMNKSVKKHSEKKNRPTNIIMQQIYSLDKKPADNDTDEIYNAKRSLSSLRPKDLQVVLIPEKPDILPEF